MKLFSNIPRLARRKAVLIASLALLAAQATPSLAEPPQRTITVYADGIASATPDMALLRLGVLSHAATAKEALNNNGATMQQIVNKLKASNIADTDMQTSNLSIFEDTDKNNSAKIIGYAARNEITVKIHDLSTIGKIYDEAVAAGANNNSALSFVNADDTKYVTEARIKAVKEAFSQAQILAKAAGVKLGPIISLVEETVEPPLRLTRNLSLLAGAASASTTTIEKGQIDYKATVNANFAIAP